MAEENLKLLFMQLVMRYQQMAMTSLGKCV